MVSATTVTMIERMYWEHGYSEEQIANRLRADPRVVSRIVSKDYVEIQHWDEDNNRYTVERQQRERKTPLRTEGETMIFPDLPKRIDWTRADHIEAVEAYRAKTPLQGIEEPVPQSRITVEEWYIKHGLATDPAALNRSKEPIDWSSRESWEFYMIVCAFVCWVAYWLGVHRGAW